jgi:hypothetical protein
LPEGGGIDAIRSVLSQIGCPKQMFGSANNTWIDRAELAGVGRESAGSEIMRLYGHLPELFSVGPLAAVAAAVTTGAAGALKKSGVLCTGYDGVVSGTVVGS